ncbi:hypothetical protein WR25_18579 [Diploscapter pachys]|uniref:PDZ domain-containing protein n=1 Tax=Diploscapter pachys TaxID=2018661 RepID=A0A2A2K8D2_9BILA|nr:hypothetical protein WR25_18579 [Diploscapter pachys]
MQRTMKSRSQKNLEVVNQLSIQLPTAEAPLAGEDSDVETSADVKQRTIVLKRKPGGSLGISIKGGTETQIVISKILAGMPADETGELFVGDAIIQVNDVSTQGKTHDEVVEMLRSESSQVKLTVRHVEEITPFLKRKSSESKGESPFERHRSRDRESSAGRTGKAQSEVSERESRPDINDDKWTTVRKIQLPMAYVSTYLEGTDIVRSNAFEVRSVDGKSSGIVHCEDEKTYKQWLDYIHKHIQALNHKSIKLSNKYLSLCEQATSTTPNITERTEGSDKWQPRFLILKGADVCLFENPPLNSEDLNRCVYLYKCYDTAVKLINSANRLDKRENTIWLETGGDTALPIRHYFAFETKFMMTQFEGSFNKCIYSSVSAMQTRTFACSYEGRPCGIVFDMKQGISLYDIPTKSYVWQYRFRDLHSSTDDGIMTFELVFKDERSLAENKLERKVVECDQLMTLVFNMHAFFLAKIVAADPDFLKKNPLT